MQLVVARECAPFIAGAVVASAAEILRSGMVNLLRTELKVADIFETSNWSNAQACLRRRELPSLIVINTDVVSGPCHTLLRHLRLSHPELRIVVVGQCRERMKILALISSGAHAYVLESTPLDEIAKALRMVAAGHIYLPDLVADVSVPDRPVARGDGALTPRQEQVLHLLVGGASNKEIATALNLAEGTIKVHLSGLFKTLGVHSRTGAVASVHAQAY